MEHLCYLCLVFFTLSHLFIAALRSPADLLVLVCDVQLCYVTFPCCILDQVWYMVVSIPDLCRLSYYYKQDYAPRTK